MLITLSLLSTVWDIIVFLFVLGLVICIHELGHFFFAKKAGILCHEFAFGMGPRIWSKKRGETLFSIRAVPFGGFVSMAGEELESEVLKKGQKIRVGFNSKNEINRIVIKSNDPKYHDYLELQIEDFDLSSEAGARLYINEYTVNREAMYVMNKDVIQIAPKDRSFANKTKTQRFLTTFGGPLMNFILAFFVFFIISLSVGVADGDSTVVSDVSDNMPASDIVLAGDEILSINGVDVTSWTEESNSVSSELSATFDSYEIVVLRETSEGVFEQVVLETFSPQLIFYGLGFTSTVGSDELLVGTPTYTETELLSGDQILSINDVVMTTWDDVVDFAIENKAGSEDDEDPFNILIYRETTSPYAGTISKIETDPSGYYLVTIDYVDLDDNQGEVVYTINSSETLLVSEGDIIEADTQIASGSNYSFSYLVYGEKVFDANDIDYFSTRIGISGSTKFSFFGSFVGAGEQFLAAGGTIFKTLGLLFTSSQVGVSDLSGFVGIFSLTSDYAALGIIALLSWIGFLSVNLGIINLLPIPALDGGRLVFIGYEAIVGRKPNQKVENWLHTIMFFLLMGLLIYITFNDIVRLFK